MFDDDAITDTLFQLTNGKKMVEAGIKQEEYSMLKRTQIRIVLGNLWHISDKYWEDYPDVNISRLKVEIDAYIKDELTKNFRVSFDEIFAFLLERGFMPLNIYAFLTGFLLKEYATDSYRYSTGIDGNSGDALTAQKLKLPTDAKNFSKMLKLMESGRSSLTVQSDLPLMNVKEINTFHDAIKSFEPHFDAPPAALPDDLWQEYFSDKNCVGYPPEHWRTFAAGFKNKIDNPYLKHVFAQSADFDAYCRNLFFALLEVDDDKLFAEFYPQRKAIVKNISSPHLAEYFEILANFPASEALKYLTDNTVEERRAMIQVVCGNEKIPELLTKNYPALNDYLTDYDFGDVGISVYFRQYKAIKLCNVDDKNFKQAVQEVAANRPYNRFDTRQTILDKTPPNAKLYWLDALGVKFLSYIKAQVSRIGLSIEIQVARAELPTLTAMNKNFYDEWRGDKFDKNSKLDELKHSPEKFDAEGHCSAPTYLADELSIIDDVLTEIKHALTARRAKKIVLTSDHGASRLAVMFGREINFRTNSVGEHSGRCCPINEVDTKPQLATEENGYWVMAGYDRFAGGRLFSVEVHSGATLEEILVPVITIAIAKR